MYELEGRYLPPNHDHLYRFEDKKIGGYDPLFLRARNSMSEHEFKDFCLKWWKENKSKNVDFTYADGYKASALRASLAVREANRYRLVKESKSPTEDELLEIAYKRSQFVSSSQALKFVEPPVERAVVEEWEMPRTKTQINTNACKTVIEFREWQESYRIRTEAECISGMAPPLQVSRESEMLTSRGATKISESCEYMHLKKGGFKTFVTGTFKEEARQRIYSGETTIQKEVTRTLDALQKMFQRGWTKKNGDRVEGHSEGLPYLWVVEVPENEKGEPNPHIHMLLGWSVKYQDFKEWSERIETIWGNGYFHLEKIKDSECAGAYMAKAAGYLSKAQDKDDQGRVEGNRYGISKTARAPSWVVVSHAQLHAMGQLIYDVYDHLTVKYGHLYRERKKLNDTLSKTPKNNKGMRNKIGKRLAEVRQKVREIPVRCNKYQLVLKGKSAAAAFFSWAKTSNEQSVKVEWLPEKPEGWEWQEGPRPTADQTQYFSRLYAKFRAGRFWRRLVVPRWMRQTCDEASHFRAYYGELLNLEPVEDYGLVEVG